VGKKMYMLRVLMAGIKYLNHIFANLDGIIFEQNLENPGHSDNYNITTIL